jgi:hypothetical protein
LKRVFNTIGFWKIITQIVSQKDLPPRGFTEDLDHGTDMGDGFGRGA